MLALSVVMLLLACLGYFANLAVAGMGHGPRFSWTHITGEFLPVFVFFGYMIYHFAVHPRGLVSLGLGVLSIAGLLFLFVKAEVAAAPNARIVAAILLFFIAMWCVDRFYPRGQNHSTPPL